MPPVALRDSRSAARYVGKRASTQERYISRNSAAERVMMVMFKRGCFVLLLISAAAYGSSCAPTAPSPATTYSGSISDSFFGAGALTVTLTTVQGLASGTWLATYPGKASQLVLAISGPVSGSTYSARVTGGSTDGNFFGPDCQLQFTGTLTGTRLSGSYRSLPTAAVCPPRTGTVDLTKQ